MAITKMTLLALVLGSNCALAASDDDIYGTGDDISIDPSDYDCALFSDIFTGGEQMCNSMWGSSFYYERNESIAYTWWYFDQENSPNDAATLARGLQVPNTCNVTYYHKSEPSAEGDAFTECHPWKENACCHEATVTTPYYMNTVYGPGYRWDRCGALSPACERFFVAEACFYECDVNIGHFRTFSDAEVANCADDWCAGNTWSVTGIPVKASYCESFYDACRNDYFHDSGDYWDAYTAYEKAWNASLQEAKKDARSTTTATTAKTKLAPWALPVILIAVFVAIVGCGGAVYMMTQEQRGKPVFQPLSDITPVAPMPEHEQINVRASA
jgi:folate receptor